MFFLISRHPSSLLRVHLLIDVLLLGLLAKSYWIFVISDLPWSQSPWPQAPSSTAKGSATRMVLLTDDRGLLQAPEIYRELMLQNIWRRIENVPFVDFASLLKKPKRLCIFRHHLSLVIEEKDGVGECSLWTEGVAGKRHLLEFLLVASDHWLQYAA